MNNELQILQYETLHVILMSVKQKNLCWFLDLTFVIHY